MAQGIVGIIKGGISFAGLGQGKLPDGYIDDFNALEGNALSDTDFGAHQALYDTLTLNNLWNGTQFLYTFPSSSSLYHKYNLKDYRDLDAAYRLTFNNDSADAHTSKGYVGNRALGRSASTHYIFGGDLASVFIGVYVTIAEVADANNRSLLGGTNNNPDTNRVLIARSFAGTTRGELANTSGGIVDGGTGNRTKLGFIGISNINGVVKLWDGLNVVATVNKTSPLAGGTLPLQLLDYMNNQSTNHSYSDAALGTAFLVKGLTESQIPTYIQAVIDFNAAVSR